ncbi:MAG TPA: epoxide hydrolase [Magnetospirillaceae bacterium]|nr:epoxide hydrolase [Magnetospirillaceae bacterium]
MTIKPFTVSVSEADLETFKNRIKNARFPHEIRGQGWKRGMPLAYTKRLASHWADTYDWRKHEAALNAFPQFIAQVDGQPIHFIHVRSKESQATPLMMVHGYPGSFVDFIKMIEPLTDPVKHGGEAKNAFDVVVPSLPGFGFSTPVKDAGWDINRTAKAFHAIMQQLDYKKYALHGSDVGAGVCEELCILAGDQIIGSLIATDPGAIATDYTPPTNHLTEAEKAHHQELKAARAEDFGYIHIQSTRPQTMSYSLTDSPVGQLAWIVEKFKEWTDPAKELPEDKLDIDHLLTNVSVYWFGYGGEGAANLLYEAHHAAAAWGKSHKVTQGFVVFGKEPLIRRILDPDHKIAHWTEFPHGAHFPSYEAPLDLVSDIRTFVSDLTK